MEQNFSKKIVIIYHGGCADGFTGAWVAWKKFGDTAHYYGASHAEPPLDYLKGKTIYFIDFCYSVPVVRKLIAQNIRVTVLDHHISTEKATKAATYHRYAVQHSGCVLAWEYFCPGKPVPRFLKHIEDIDLGIPTKLKDSRAVRTLLEIYGLNFAVVSRLMHGLEDAKQRKKLLALGSVVIAYQNRVVKELAYEFAEHVKFAGYEAYAVNSPFLEDYIAQELIKRKPPIGIVWRSIRGTIRVSLRSNGGADVAKIAERFGGGGHAQSSGFTIPSGSKLPWTTLLHIAKKK